MLGEWGREEGKKERRKEGDEERGRGRSRELAEGGRVRGEQDLARRSFWQVLLDSRGSGGFIKELWFLQPPANDANSEIQYWRWALCVT